MDKAALSKLYQIPFESYILFVKCICKGETFYYWTIYKQDRGISMEDYTQ